MKFRRLLALSAAVLLLPETGRSDGFPIEWALLKGAARERLTERLAEHGRTNEVALLRALAADDRAESERAMRRLVEENGDRRLGRCLVRLLNASGRTAEAEELERTLRTESAPRKKLMAGTTPRFSGKTPVVFLHGYNGSADTWSDFLKLFLSADGGYEEGDVIVFQYYDDDDNSSGLTEGLTTFGYTVDTKISTVAARVESAVTTWLRRRAEAMSGGMTPTEAELPAVDWVCHSMGGLVLRNIIRDRPELVRRCVTLGTPHFGQIIGGNVVIGQLVGHQAHEMSFGSSSLWNLAADWRFLGKRTDDILYVAGMAAKRDNGIVDDGLITTFSATMQTAEDERFAHNTFFVRRIHSTVLAAGFNGIPALTELSSCDDTVFRLVHGYLNDSEYFADGGRPSQEQVLVDEGCTDPCGKLELVASRGALFVQVMDGVTNTAERLETPVEYDSGLIKPDSVVESLTFADGVYEDEGDGLERESGYDDEGCGKGLVMLYGQFPTGDCVARIDQPYRTSRPKYDEIFHLAGGGVTLVRTRPRAARPMSAAQVADVDGKSKSVVVANDWLAEKGLVNSAENLSACVTASAECGANGCPVAASYLLGLDPADAESKLRIASLTVGEELVFGVSAGVRPLKAGSAPVVLQAKDALDDESWRTVAVPSGAWTLPRSSGRFFRAALKW